MLQATNISAVRSIAAAEHVHHKIAAGSVVGLKGRARTVKLLTGDAVVLTISKLGPYQRMARCPPTSARHGAARDSRVWRGLFHGNESK